MAGEHILICDDGRENRDFIVEYIIRPNDYEPLIARNGLEAMDIMRQEPVDLMLLDLQMPKMGGLEVLDAMVAEQIDIPVVLMTFHGSEEIAIEVYRKGVRDYVKKPFSVEEMQGAIQRALSEVHLRQEKEKLTERLINANTEMNQRIRELKLLYNVGKRVTALTSMDDLLPGILGAAIEITGSEAGSLYLVQGDQLIGRAIKQAGEPGIRMINQPLENPFARRAIQTANPLLLNRVEMEGLRRSNKNPDLPEAVVVTPVIIGRRAIGAIMVNNVSSGSREFRAQDSTMLSALSDYAAIAIENARNLSDVAQYRQHGTSSSTPNNQQVVQYPAMMLLLQFVDTSVGMPPEQHWETLSAQHNQLINALHAAGAYTRLVSGNLLLSVWDMHVHNPMDTLRYALRIGSESNNLRFTLHAANLMMVLNNNEIVATAGDALDNLLQFHLAGKEERIMISKSALRYFEVDQIDVEPLKTLPGVRFLNIIS